MKENTWLNTRDNTYIGPNTVLGSPRGWLQRAYGYGAGELFLHETSTDPKQISVGGIWRRGQPLPDTGSWPAIYRRFQLCDNIRRYNRAKPSDLYPVVGMGVAVPADRVFEVYNLFRRTADWVWMDWPAERNRPQPRRSMAELDHGEIYRRFQLCDNIRRYNRAKPAELYPVVGMGVAVPVDRVFEVYNLFRKTADWVWMDWPAERNRPQPRRSMAELDHGEIYRLFEQGLTVKQVADKLNVLSQSVNYVHKKWQSGVSSDRKPRNSVDHNLVAEDLRMGRPVMDIVRSYNISRTMVYKIKQEFDLK